MAERLKTITFRNRNGVSVSLAVNALAGADLSGADLAGADLLGVSLRGANLFGANLSGANLSGADLSGADLSGANLSSADLRSADLSGVDLRSANLSGAVFGYTFLSGVTGLHQVSGLEAIRHDYASSPDAETLRRSFKALPVAFLKGLGYTDSDIEVMRAVYGKTQSDFSCYLSFARADIEFAQRLYTDLQARGVNCGKDDRNLRGGEYWQFQSSQGVHLHDKTIVVCSEVSLKRVQVVRQILHAADKRKPGDIKSLYPIRVDGFIESDEVYEYAADQAAGEDWPLDWIRRLRAVELPDFSDWRDTASYERALTGLIDDLRAPPPPRSL